MSDDRAGNVLLMTVGLPRAGKSTWARAQGCPVVNPDSIRKALHGQDYYPDAEPFVWAVAELMVRSLFFAGHRRVVLDATNMRREYRQRFRSPDWSCTFMVFDTPMAVCIERATQDGKESLIPVIEKMSKVGYYEPPDRSEGLVLRWPSPLRGPVRVESNTPVTSK